VMNILRPVIRQLSPSRVARVVIAATSEPVSGSVTAHDVMISPFAIGGSQRSFCSSVPCRTSARAVR